MEFMKVKLYFRNGDKNLVIYTVDIIQVQVIEGYWTDEAYDHGLAWHSHPPKLSAGTPVAIPDY